MPCLDDATLLRYLSGDTDDATTTMVATEIDACAACRELLATVATDWAAQHGELGDGLRPGSALGRYRVDGLAGRGAMGVVYRGWDPVVARPVALKVLAAGAAPDVDALLREARAMGRVAHPNVVTVFDAGVEGAQVYLAMERIAGETLGAYVARARPPAATLMRMFADAADGLGAAHAAGVIHRDFKPDNVFVTAGRVQVSDFGLARVAEERDLPATPPPPPPSARGTWAAGTPAYMAPEQFDGLGPDARSDQYSLCVALFELLTGRRPIAASTVSAQRVAAAAPAAIDWRGVPRRLRPILRRGLAPAPDARWPDMATLAQRLRGAARAPWRRGAIAVTGALVLGVGALAWPRGAAPTASPPLDACAEAAREVEAIWSPAQADALQARLVAAAPGLGATTGPVVTAALTGYATQLAAGHRRVCQARRGTSVAPALLDRQATCQAGLRGELAALVERLRTPDGEVVTRAVEAVDTLVDPAACDDVVGLGEQVALPVDPRQVAEVAALGQRLAQAKAQQAAGDAAAAERAVDALIAPATAAGYAPLLADVQLTRGRIARERGDDELATTSLQAALLAAIGGRARRLEAEIRIAQVRLAVGTPATGRPEVAQGLAEARAALSGLALPAPALVAELDVVEAMRDAWLGDVARATSTLAALVARAETAAWASPQQRAVWQALLGRMQGRAGDAAGALATLRAATALAAQAFGDGHPRYAFVAGQLAVALMPTDVPGALKLAAHVAELAVQQGAERPAAFGARNQLMKLYAQADRPTEALAVARAQLAARTALGDRAGIGRDQHDVGTCLVTLGQWAEARDAFEAALRDLAVLGDPHALLLTQVALAEALLETGAAARALDVAGAAVATLTARTTPLAGVPMDPRRLLGQAEALRARAAGVLGQVRLRTQATRAARAAFTAVGAAAADDLAALEAWQAATR